MTDKFEGWPTTRCYPRTMNDAFRDDISNTEWWFPPEKTWQDRAVFWFALFIWCGLLTYWWRWV